jgi:hypothetical protein
MSSNKVEKQKFHISSLAFLHGFPYLGHSLVAALKQRYLQASRCKCCKKLVTLAEILLVNRFYATCEIQMFYCKKTCEIQMFTARKHCSGTKYLHFCLLVLLHLRSISTRNRRQEPHTNKANKQEKHPMGKILICFTFLYTTIRLTYMLLLPCTYLISTTKAMLFLFLITKT